MYVELKMVSFVQRVNNLHMCMNILNDLLCVSIKTFFKNVWSLKKKIIYLYVILKISKRSENYFKNIIYFIIVNMGINMLCDA